MKERCPTIKNALRKVRGKSELPAVAILLFEKTNCSACDGSRCPIDSIKKLFTEEDEFQEAALDSLVERKTNFLSAAMGSKRSCGGRRYRGLAG